MEHPRRILEQELDWFYDERLCHKNNMKVTMTFIVGLYPYRVQFSQKKITKIGCHVQRRLAATLL